MKLAIPSDRLCVVGVVIVIALGLVATPVSAQGTTVDTAGGTTSPGETVTVSITVTETNTLKLDDIPADWNVTGTTGDADTSNENEVRWVFFGGSGSGETTVTVTLLVPESTAIGDYSMSVTATQGETTITESVAVSVAANSHPSAKFTVTPADPEPGEMITVNASESSDPDGTITEYAWDFDGDNVTETTGVQSTHVYEAGGNYTISLTVSDNESATTTTSQTVSVTEESSSETTGGSSSTTVSVLLAEAPNGIETFNITISGNGSHGIVDVSGKLLSGNNFEKVSGGNGASSVTARGADFAFISPFTSEKTLFTVTFDGNVTESNLTVTVNQLTNDNGQSMDPDLVSVSVPQDTPLFGSALGGGEGPPTDPDDDGLFEDVDGNGKATFADALALAFVQSDQLSDEQINALDFDNDGDVDFDDAFELAFTI